MGECDRSHDMSCVAPVFYVTGVLQPNISNGRFVVSESMGFAVGGQVDRVFIAYHASLRTADVRLRTDHDGGILDMCQRTNACTLRCVRTHVRARLSPGLSHYITTKNLPIGTSDFEIYFTEFTFKRDFANSLDSIGTAADL